MAKTTFLILSILVSLVSTTPISASEIASIDVSKLNSLSTHIVIGEVISVTSNNSGLDDVRVGIGSILKGKTEEKIFNIQLQSAGVKDFDPKFKQGDVAVFFLKSLANGRGEKASHGSVATFTKLNFK